MLVFKLLFKRGKLDDFGPLPPPMDSITESRKQEARYLGQMQLTFFTVVFCALPQFVTIYFAVTQLSPVTDYLWHAVFGDGQTSDFIRDAGELYCAAFEAGAVTFNRYYYLKQIHGDPTRWDKIKERLWIPSMRDDRPLSLKQFACMVGWCILLAIPMFIAGQFIINILMAHIHDLPSWLAASLDPAPKVPSKDFRVLAGRLIFENWPNKLMGAFIAMGTMWVARPFFMDIQEYFVTRRLGANKELRWYHRFFVPGFTARYNELEASPSHARLASTSGQIVWLRTLLSAASVLTVVGWWLYYYYIPRLLEAKLRLAGA